MFIKKIAFFVAGLFIISGFAAIGVSEEAGDLKQKIINLTFSDLEITDNNINSFSMLSMNGADGCLYIDGSPKGWEQIHIDTEWVYVIQPTKNRQKNSFPGFLGEPEVAVYDWQNYWFAEADPEQTQPRPLSRVRLLQAKETGLGWKGS